MMRSSSSSTVLESELFISERVIADPPQYVGTIKLLASDFIVREIPLANAPISPAHPLHFSDLHGRDSVDAPAEQQRKRAIRQHADEIQQTEQHLLADLSLRDLLGAEVEATLLHAFPLPTGATAHDISIAAELQRRQPPVRLPSWIADKDTRRRLYLLLYRALPHTLASVVSLADHQGKCIEISHDPSFWNLVPLVGLENAMTMKRFANELVPDGSIVTITAPLSAEQRTELHLTLRRQWPHVQSRTLQSNDNAIDTAGTSTISLTMHRGHGGPMRSKRDSAQQLKYTWLMLAKAHRSTLDVADSLAGIMNCPSHRLSYAGIKDKHAFTVQLLVANSIDASRLVAAAKQLAGVSVGHCLDQQSMPLRTGDLLGNEFHIVLRDVGALTPNTVASDAESSSSSSMASISAEFERRLGLIRERGIINYFGLQRFGKREDGGHLVGACVLRGHYYEAIRLLLRYPHLHHAADHQATATSSADESPAKRQKTSHSVDDKQPLSTAASSTAASSTSTSTSLSEVDCVLRAFWQSGNLRTTVQALPRSASRTLRNLLQFLRKKAPNAASVLDDATIHSPTLWKQAVLHGLPWNSLNIMLASVQSQVWNAVASQRIATLGFRVVVGDLVSGDSEHASAVRRIETDDEAQRYQVQDVVLPLPPIGAAKAAASDRSPLLYPSAPGVDRALYETALSDLGLSLELLERFTEMRLVGGYRKLVVQPSSLSHSVVQYSQPNEPLFLDTSLNQAERRVLESANQNSHHGDGYRSLPSDSESPGEQQRRTAVQVCFQLPPGSYATIVLRELIRVRE